MAVRLPELNMVPTLRTPRPAGGSVSVMENLILSMVDGTLTVGELGATCGLDADMAQRIVHRLFTERLVQIEAYDPDAVAPVASPPPLVPEQTADATPPRVVVDSDMRELFSRMSAMNHYEVLGVAPDADRTQIRTAYFALSRKYHPDAYFGKVDADTRDQLGRLFHRITLAYDTLNIKSRRARYDESIADQIALWRVEADLKAAVAQRTPSPSAEAPVGLSSHAPLPRNSIAPVAGARRTPAVHARRTPPAAPAPGRAPLQRRASLPPSVESVQVTAAARISRIPVTRDSVIPPPARPASPLLPFSGSSSIPPGPIRSSSIPPFSPAAAPDDEDTPESAVSGSAAIAAALTGGAMRDEKREQWKRERMIRALGGQQAAPGQPVRAKVPEPAARPESLLLEHARIAIERQEYDVATVHLQEILKRDGDNEEAIRMLEAARAGKILVKAREWMRQGRFDYEKGRVREALGSFEKALKLDGENLESRYYMARCLYDLRMDLDRAFELTKEIVGLGGRKGKYYHVMAELLLLANERTRAVEALERAVKLEPDNREYQKKLKAIKR